ncbi:hypothetical protein FBQ99_16050 [Chloroflexi bacterium CFX2]|nr:hypothetical protein [Chloroflexi bacterium CFX2]
MGSVRYFMPIRRKIMEAPALKPLSIAELLDKALQLYKRHALLLLSIFAVVLIPSAVISSISIFYLNDSRLVDAILAIVLSVLAELACIFAISELYLDRQVTLRSAYKTGLKRYWSRLGMGMLVGLAMIPVGLVMFLVSMVGLSVLGFIILIPVLVLLTTRWSLSACAIVLEGVGAVAGLERSWRLTDGYFWRVFGTSFAAGLLTLLLSLLPSLVVTFLFEEMLGAAPKFTLIATTR